MLEDIRVTKGGLRKTVWWGSGRVLKRFATGNSAALGRVDNKRAIVVNSVSFGKLPSEGEFVGDWWAIGGGGGLRVGRVCMR